jgi:hypothetical protein
VTKNKKDYTAAVLCVRWPFSLFLWQTTTLSEPLRTGLGDEWQPCATKEIEENGCKFNFGMLFFF